jgi:hypothetical protein
MENEFVAKKIALEKQHKREWDQQRLGLLVEHKKTLGQV